METLIETYSLQEFLLFTVTFALGIKGFISFWDWGHARLKQMFKEETEQEQEIDSIQKQINQSKENYETLKSNQNRLEGILNDLATNVSLLIDSDRDDIKSFITREHHYFCYQKGWIDDYSMDCIEKRYKHYTDEGGNSFVHNLMEELRELPTQPNS